MEGGGAKGIAHVGALSALEADNIELVGFAGTSAGAIVAALAAAGYKSDELFRPGRSILDDIDLDRTNVWGFAAEKPVRTPPRLLGRTAWLAILGSQWILRIGLWVVAMLLLLSSGLIHWLEMVDETPEFIIQSLLVLLLILTPFYITSPVAGLKGLSASINQALALKLKKSRDPQKITFADLAAYGRPPLKIVASDISRHSLKLFSAASTPDVGVGDAVAASVCIPGIFRPWRIGESLFYDGGLVSNLPAWAFDAERAIDRDAWTAVIEVADKRQPKRQWPGVGILASTLTTALFGSSALNTRNVDRLRTASLTVDLKLLQFGMKREEAAQVIESARETCRAELVYQMKVLPEQLEAVCDLIASDCRSLIGVARSAEHLDAFDGRLRAALLFPIREVSDSLLSEFCSGYGDDADERLRIPIARSFAGQACTERVAIYVEHPASTPGGWDVLPSDRWWRKLAWKDAHWGLWVPYYHDHSKAWLVVALDSDRPLGVTDLKTTLQSLAVQIGTILEANMPSETFKWISSA